MSDTVKTWIEERQAIHAKATDGPWRARPGDEIEGPGGDNLMGGDTEYFSGFMLRGENATAVADAHNMFPRALDAIEAVLKVHTPIEVNHAFKGRTNVCEQCSEDRLYALWPCETVEAIEGAFNE